MGSYIHILLDLDDTVFDFPQSEKIAFGKTMEKLGIDNVDSIRKIYTEENVKCWKQIEQKTMSREDMFWKRWANTFEVAGIKVDTPFLEINSIYMTELSKLGIYLPGAEDFLKKLRALPGHTISLITNGTSQSANGRIKASGIDQYADFIFVSHDLGYDKPDVRYFECVLNTIKDTNKEHYLVIGDSLTSDMKGANNAGLPCCLFAKDGKFPDDAESLRIDHRAASYEEILNIVKG
jgi:YjjG family noncanonical pyrimidine nucleotidase